MLHKSHMGSRIRFHYVRGRRIRVASAATLATAGVARDEVMVAEATETFLARPSQITKQK